MKIISQKAKLSGHITVPGSKSHTIRALILASMAEGVSQIKNPLPSNDCLSTAKAMNQIGAKCKFPTENSNLVWTVEGAGKNLKIPKEGIIDVGNSGSLMYFLSPILSTLKGKVTYTGDESICSRPVGHLLDALNQLGGKATSGERNKPPFTVEGPICTDKMLKTEGKLSQYISGIMMAALRMNGKIEMELFTPQETPYLTMTKMWIDKVTGEPDKVQISKDYKKISVTGPAYYKGFETVIPSDWEGVAFPLIAALISESEIIIDNVDTGESQGDKAIVDVLKSVGAEINYDQSALIVKGGKKLNTKNLKNEKLVVDMSSFPDAICALSVMACFIDGVVELKNIEICRKKETDRVKAMCSELSKLGAKVEDAGNSMFIYGNESCLHGGKVESFKDHRIVMSLACLGLGLKEGEEIEVSDAEWCSVTFPNFVIAMNGINAGFKTID
ncbi:MAG: 3-phosphoshikimate 1-carboxyvinyltransferase [Treponema sp.]|nr:3-phosphoshikimate 1-carboxyvinyltransferase [Treponema sp.]